jgi:hypothetical protein
VTTEYVAGLPTEPPVALLAAVGVGLIVALAAAGFGVVRLFSRSLPAASASSAASEAPPPKASPSAAEEPAAPAAPAASTDYRPRTQAHFACAPVACEWIVCDGENVKKGQLDLDLPPGKHSCSASRYGYRTAVTEFSIEADKTTRVVFELLPTKTAGAAVATPSTKAASTAKAAGSSKKTANTSTSSTSKSTTSKSTTSKPTTAPSKSTTNTNKSITSKATATPAKPAASSKSR